MVSAWIALVSPFPEPGPQLPPVARLEPVYPAQVVLLVKRLSSKVCVLSHSVVSDYDPMACSLPRLLCPWDSPGKNTGVGCRALLQRIFRTQGLKLHLLRLLHCRRILYPLSHQGSRSMFEAFHAGGLAPGWNLLVQGHSDSGEDQFEINFLSETGDIVFHIKPRFSSATMVANAFQGGRWGQEEASSVFPLVLGEPFEMEVSSDAEHFHVHAQEHKVLQFAHRHRPLAAITRVQVLSDHRLAQVELARKGLSWGAGGY
uniref:Galectin n=1 Tax=Bos indicus x Bos taurus TaxID=30522 RepID=A0A4W2G9T5_BOBOX